MIKTKQSILLILVCILPFIFVLAGQDTNVANAAVETYLYSLKYSYSHYDVVNDSASLDGSGNGVLTSSLQSTKTGKADLSFQMYGDSFSTSSELNNGGYINSSNIHILANTSWPSSEMKVKNSSGNVVLSGTSSLSGSLSDGSYFLEYTGIGTGWLTTSREYEYYKVIASFNFNIDTAMPNISGAIEDTLYTNETVVVSANDSLSGVDSLFVKVPSSSSFSRVSSPYTIYKENTNGLYSFYAIDRAGNVSKTYYVYLDTQKPSITLKKDGVEINSLYVNKVPTIHAIDNQETYKIYCEVDGVAMEISASYTLPVSKLIKLYCFDRANNKSDEISVYVDVTMPSLNVSSSSGIVEDKAIISSSTGISATSNDTESKVKAIYYKKSTDSNYYIYDGSSLMEDATYYFYAEDNAGNCTKSISITLDNTKPTFILYEGENAILSHYSASNYVKYYAEDLSGIKESYYLLDGVKYSYTLLTQIKAEGKYEFYSVDKANNVSDVCTIYLDRTKPDLFLYVDNNYKLGGVHNSENIKVEGYDEVSKIKEITYEYGGKNYVYNGGLINNEGAYRFYSVDNSGNISKELYFIIDKQKPTVMIFTGDGVNPAYTSKSFSADSMDNVSIYCTYVKEANDAEYRVYNYGENFSDGEYYFYTEDDAFNKSDVVKIIVDTISPKVSIYALDQEIMANTSTSKSIRFNAADQNLDKAYVKLPSSADYIEYNIGNILQEEGLYSFYAIDKAGNKSSVVYVTVDKSAPKIKLFKEGVEIVATSLNGKFTIEAEDALSNSFIFIKSPHDTKYIKYSGEELKIDGEYLVYSIDSVDNKSDVISITLDNEKPYGKIMFEDAEIKKGYTNYSFIQYEYFDALSGIENSFVIEDGTLREYHGEKLFLDAEYVFYSIDKAGNKSDEKTVILDRVNPTGEIYFDSSYEVCNVPFNFVATDNILIDKIYVKTPSNAYTEYLNSQYIVNLENGTYSFYAVDMAGNSSSIYRIDVDTIAPVGHIYAENNMFYGYYLNKSFRYVSEKNSTCYVKYPNSEFAIYDGKEISGSSVYGEYSFYSIDNAGNKSDVIHVFLDNLKPEGQIYSGTKVVDNNSFTTLSISFKGIKNGSDIVNTYVVIDNIEYLYSGEVYKEDGTYSFYAEDEASNKSNLYTVTIDTIKPKCSIYINGELSDSLYTNKDRISLSSEDKNLSTIYVKLPGSLDYTIYYQNSMYSLEGKYTFYAVDLAGNRSDDYTITIDRKPKEIEVVSLDNNIAKSNVYIKAKQNDLAPIKSVTINGFRCTLLDTIYVVDGGTYNINVLDEAGNIYSTSFTASLDMFKDKKSVFEYYESTGINNKIKSFDTYEKALENAIEKESINVSFSYWQNQEWDTGIEMDKVDSINAKQGEFYIYKDETDETKLVAYFTLDRIMQVMTKYAEKVIKHYYYYEKLPNTSSQDGVYLNEYVSTEIKLDKNFTYIIDGFMISGSSYDIPGIHKVQILDKYNNSVSYKFTLLQDKPDVYYSILGGDKYKMTNQEYFLKEDMVLSISDIDEDAVLIIKNEKSEILYRLRNDEEATLSSGRYYIQSINHLGNSTIKTVHVSKNNAEIIFTETNSSKKLEVKINPSNDLDAKITSIYIYKLIDGEFEKVLKDDYGTYITKSKYTYYFRTSYEYKVEVEDNFRSGIDMVSKKYKFKKAAPEIEITNIETGYTNKNVMVTFSDEAYVELYKNGEKVEFIQGIIKDEGIYNLYYKDYDNNETLFVFEIDKKTPIVYLDGVEDNSVTNQSVRIKCFEENVSITVYKNNEPYNYEEGDLIKEDGFYEYLLIDRALNETKGSFTIDKLINVELNTLDGGISSEDVIIEAFEELDIKVALNNDYIDYAFGQSLKDEGNYKVYLKDNADNEKTISFSIQKSKLKTFDLNLNNNLKVLEVSKDNVIEDLSSPLIFKEDGVYKITLTNGDKQSVFTIVIDTTAPIINLDGVQNGGVTSSVVKINNISEECKITGYLNGYLININENMEFIDKGVYTLYFVDEVGNESIISFEIKEGVNKPLIALIIIVIVLIVVVVGFVLIFKKKNKKIKELSIKKEEIDEEEEKDNRHILKPINLSIEEESLEAKKEIEDRDIALLSLNNSCDINVKELREKSDRLNEEEKYYKSIDYKELMKNASSQEKRKLKINSLIEDDNMGLIPAGNFKGDVEDG